MSHCLSAFLLLCLYHSSPSNVFIYLVVTHLSFCHSVFLPFCLYARVSFYSLPVCCSANLSFCSHFFLPITFPSLATLNFSLSLNKKNQPNISFVILSVSSTFVLNLLPFFSFSFTFLLLFNLSNSLSLFLPH
jgi:hypothetical protein